MSIMETSRIVGVEELHKLKEPNTELLPVDYMPVIERVRIMQDLLPWLDEDGRLKQVAVSHYRNSEWKADALCRPDPSWTDEQRAENLARFCTSRGKQYQSEAKATCTTCPVAIDCLLDECAVLIRSQTMEDGTTYGAKPYTMRAGIIPKMLRMLITRPGDKKPASLSICFCGRLFPTYERLYKGEVTEAPYSCDLPVHRMATRRKAEWCFAMSAQDCRDYIQINGEVQ